MGYRYAIIGAGRTGTAAAFDLITHGEADEVRLFDRDPRAVEQSTSRVEQLTGHAGVRGARLDARHLDEVFEAIQGADAVLSASAYWLNADLARVALAAGAHFNDLGGNTEVVRRELEIDEIARQAGVSVVPDCGLAPGLVNTLAAAGIAEFDACERVRMRVGGLPQDPQGPLDYALVFSISGLTNEYQGHGLVLRNGELHEVPCLTDLETTHFDGLGELEAFVTSGGTSTAPHTFFGKVLDYDYKTLRYPGHCEKIALLQDLGLLSLDPVEVEGERVVPRRVFEAVAGPRLSFPNSLDLVALRVTCEGTLADGRAATRVFELVDRHDMATGFSAMERTTAFPATVVTWMQASGAVAPGARPLEVSVPPEPFLEALGRRDLPLRTRLET